MKITNLRTLPLLALLFVSLHSFGQADVRSTITNYLSAQADDYRITPAQAGEFAITDDYTSRHNGVRHVYITQTVNGLRIVNRILNVTIAPNGEIVRIAGQVAPLAAIAKPSPDPGLHAGDAILSACDQLNIAYTSAPEPLPSVQTGVLLYAGGDISQENIPIELVYWISPEDELILAWSLSIYTHDSDHWYHAMVDANTGQKLEVVDWVVHCAASVCGKFPTVGHTHISKPAELAAPAAPMPLPAMNTGSYRVLAFPTETPVHGARTLVVNPADSLASPYGWHDTNGQPGAEYTITRGNNVHAYEDSSNNNSPGYSPNGGPTLTFDYPVNFNLHPRTYVDAAVTNLFYANNMIHDIIYRFGFDEVSGNFQVNNYGRGGIGGDDVRAEAQDGGGSNNANFATPPDGSRPRMQMYLWSAGSSVNFTVNSPLGLAGTYAATGASFGNALPTTPLTSDLVLALDNAGLDSLDACETLVNATALAGKIAVIRRGNCPFVDKVQAAQNAGAIAVVMVNNVAGNPITMGGSSSTITIPSIMISQGNGDPIIAALRASTTVNASLSGSGAGVLDGDFDNGVIVHEYGHGISIRLTGGPATSSCLGNAEQMGEGWSDYFGCMMTMDLTAANPVNRPIGAYLLGNTLAGPGIRNASYDTSFAVNGYTYGDVNNTGLLSQPHGVGFVWATMLWDLTWDLMAVHGYDNVLGNGIGGDDIAMQLVMDGLKLQPCSPGFVDGRDAILLADQLNYGGANRCLIWKAFAKRGLGFSASQGSSASRTDQVEAFDIPVSCMIAIAPPKAGFTVDTTFTCSGKVIFTDQSDDIPQAWFWDFGDGNTDTVQNPVHQYASPGLYTVKLIVANTIGTDTVERTDYIDFSLPIPPSADNVTLCAGDSIVLVAKAQGTTIWLDGGFIKIADGDTLVSPALLATTKYNVVNKVGPPAGFVGPKNETFGTGGQHGTTFTGTVDFTAEVSFTIVSAYINAASTGTRTISLWDNFSGGGNLIQQVQVSISSSGPQRIELGFEIPGPGNYSIGLNNANMYRNNAGVSYPYTLPGVASIVGSSAGNGYYYYFYDLEIDPLGCLSDTVEVTAQVINAADFSYADSALTVNFTDLSGAISNWHWDFGDGNTSSDPNPTHTYALPGIYTVTLSIGSCTISYQVNVTNTGINSPKASDWGAILQPNPAQESTMLQLARALPTDVTLRLITMDGRVAGTWPLRAGELQLTLPIGHLAPAVYMLIADDPQYGISLPLVVMD